MAIELNYLVASVAIYFLMIIGQAVLSDKEHGIKHGASARDNSVDKGLFLQRAKRANANMVESLLMFAPLVLVAALTARFNAMTAIGASLFFWGRLAYAPLYWFGVPWLRSAAWFVSLIGIVLVFLQIVPFTSAGA